MNRFVATFGFFALLAISLFPPFGMASAQTLINTIPLNQAPLARIFPPTVAEQTPHGVGKFIIFTREHTNKTNEWDFVAGAWECIPWRPNLPVTKRIEFCHSSWSATPLLDYPDDDSRECFPQFVRLQVDAGNFTSKVNLYDINYRTWQTRCIWQGNYVNAFGVIKNCVFCKTAFGPDSDNSNNWCRLDAASGKTTKDAPFVPLEVDGTFWLVRKPDEKSGNRSYDTAKEKFVGHFGDVEKSQIRNLNSLLSADGKNRARVLGALPDRMAGGWSGGLIEAGFVLQRDGQSEDIRVPVTLQAEPVRGTRLLRPIGSRLFFNTNGTAEFSAIQTTNARTERVLAIDLVTSKITESERPYVAPKENDYAIFDGVPAAEYLRPYLKNLWHFGRGGLAVAFLMQQHILKNPPEFPDCTAGVSRDGRHILYKAKEGPLANFFIYGDLQTKRIIRWPSPVGFELCDSLDFLWVETP